MRRTAATVIGTAAFLGFLATPANAEEAAPAHADTRNGISAHATPSNWTWTATSRNQSNWQSQNGLVNLASGGNSCVGLLGVLAPVNSCPSS